MHQIYRTRPIRICNFKKKLRSASAWVLYCKFAGDLENTFLEENLWGTGTGF